MRMTWLVSALVFAALLALLDRWALATYLYWRHPWSDTFMHTLGGITMGVLAIGIIGRKFRPLPFLMFVLVASVGWEVFEYLIGASHYSRSFVLDTSSDLLFDAVGGTLAYVIARFSIWRSA